MGHPLKGMIKELPLGFKIVWVLSMALSVSVVALVITVLIKLINKL